MSDDDSEKSPFAGALADQLDGLDIDTAEADRPNQSAANPDESADAVEAGDGPDARRRQASKPGQANEPGQADRSGPGPAGPDLARPEPDDDLSADELFAQTVDQIAPEDVYSGKFGAGEPDDAQQAGRADAAGQADPGASKSSDQPSAQQQPPADQSARQQVGRARQMRQFQKAIGPVDEQPDRDKYRRDRPPDPAEHAAQQVAGDAQSPDDLRTPALAKSGDGLTNARPLAAAHKELLGRFDKRTRRDDTPEINLRGDTVEDALRQLELFIHHQCKQGARFVRVIHGRGLRSSGPPVVKPAVLYWLEGGGLRYVRGYAPEVNSGGDYGSLIVELVEQV